MAWIQDRFIVEQLSQLTDRGSSLVFGEKQNRVLQELIAGSGRLQGHQLPGGLHASGEMKTSRKGKPHLGS